MRTGWTREVIHQEAWIYQKVWTHQEAKEPDNEKNPDHVDVTADVYSTGVMLYKMLAGRLPEKKTAAVSHLNPDLEMGFVERSDLTGFYHAKAVRSGI